VNRTSRIPDTKSHGRTGGNLMSGRPFDRRTFLLTGAAVTPFGNPF
jgi:hypothetical protein